MQMDTRTTDATDGAICPPLEPPLLLLARVYGCWIDFLARATGGGSLFSSGMCRVKEQPPPPPPDQAPAVGGAVRML